MYTLQRHMAETIKHIPQEYIQKQQSITRCADGAAAQKKKSSEPSTRAAEGVVTVKDIGGEGLVDLTGHPRGGKLVRPPEEGVANAGRVQSERGQHPDLTEQLAQRNFLVLDHAD
eukprot:CAMPEP_0181204032 /NCGR_PEP_ID=MMETSP1096-20121128/19713_1 /TAXON_ID=156174 ORGANISM="Chrysochromulina ericina, Strain CCMP281" /NCGR_SAMPLE_ID=MMETSP1096 /ASSEMBLY_ACC=CAM_ASM_000453 /LENGTH=114 /DNA_ID=CAMNT_0023294693 /DNA_START=345 /DNA_END=688 /DNA_ORIENTATION=+